MYMTLDNICDKIKLLSSYRNKPVTFKIEDLTSSKKGYPGEKFCSSSCKFALGIFKYLVLTSTFALRELGRFPIKSKIILHTGTKHIIPVLAIKT